MLERPNYFLEWFVAVHYSAIDYHQSHPSGGRVHAFQTIADVSLLAFDNPHNVRTLKRMHAFRTPEMRRRLRIAFPALLNDGRVVREFGSVNDIPIVSELCRLLGVNGVASRSVPSDVAQHRVVVHE